VEQGALLTMNRRGWFQSVNGRVTEPASAFSRNSSSAEKLSKSDVVDDCGAFTPVFSGGLLFTFVVRR
jgi:hypothetical protein